MNQKSLILNCDMGEGIGNDAAIMPFIDAASIACGYHAGDTTTIRTTISLAKKYDVKIGAHVSFPDKENFGRTAMLLSTTAIYNLVQEQLQIFLQLSTTEGMPVYHVKPHGALYNQAAKDFATAQAVANAIKDIDPTLVVFGLSNSYSITAATAIGLSVAQEAFADRSYQDDGSLTTRSQEGSLIENVDDILIQVKEITSAQSVTTLSGKKIFLNADTICVHGDNPNAETLVEKIYHWKHEK